MTSVGSNLNIFCGHLHGAEPPHLHASTWAWHPSMWTS